ncbi:nuclear transport factor 2 family protein [Streptacidiphilus jiangxiensis]|uniref:SnoaL-like domain-containing protein n=1 Tax=Streptacidiphilus jiangxiensis TaxID=235985 RepID=A0A1H7YLS9_STRJI|nr:nuclear transport factor 2 family protein [Streptacidiphilus jiangxiensis]SEM46268.1 SnoaL-like domain-containing protein [Streptacidiphilus jiangxiensis]
MEITATTLQDLADRYLAAWNETDPALRRRLVDASWAEDGRYTDPLVVAEGREAFDATLGAVQAQFPGLVFRMAGPVDAHHDIARFSWELGPADGEALVVGFDVLVADAEGRIAQVHGFLDKVPAA